MRPIFVRSLQCCLSVALLAVVPAPPADAGAVPVVPVNCWTKGTLETMGDAAFDEMGTVGDGQEYKFDPKDMKDCTAQFHATGDNTIPASQGPSDAPVAASEESEQPSEASEQPSEASEQPSEASEQPSEASEEASEASEEASEASEEASEASEEASEDSSGEASNDEQ